MRSTRRFAQDWQNIRNSLEEYGVELHPQDADMSVSFCDPTSRIYQSVGQVMPGKYELFPFASDQAGFRQFGIPMVIYGPGDVHSAHKGLDEEKPDRVHTIAIEECNNNLDRMIQEFAVFQAT